MQYSIVVSVLFLISPLFDLSFLFEDLRDLQLQPLFLLSVSNF